MSEGRRQLRYRDYLGHMLEAVRLARSYTEGLSKAHFLADKRTQQYERSRAQVQADLDRDNPQLHPGRR